MLAPADNRFGPTTNQHSIANRLALEIPNPGWDSNPLIQVTKANLEAGFQGNKSYGLRGPNIPVDVPVAIKNVPGTYHGQGQHKGWTIFPSQAMMGGNNADTHTTMESTVSGMSGLSFDGTGLFGTGLFSGDVTSWGPSELVAGLIGAYAAYSMFFQAKQTKYRLEASAHRRRKSKAAKYRAKAKMLEEKSLGGVFA